MKSSLKTDAAVTSLLLDLMGDAAHRPSPDQSATLHCNQRRAQLILLADNAAFSKCIGGELATFHGLSLLLLPKHTRAGCLCKADVYMMQLKGVCEAAGWIERHMPWLWGKRRNPPSPLWYHIQTGDIPTFTKDRIMLIVNLYHFTKSSIILLLICLNITYILFLVLAFKMYGLCVQSTRLLIILWYLSVSITTSLTTPPKCLCHSHQSSTQSQTSWVKHPWSSTADNTFAFH